MRASGPAVALALAALVGAAAGPRSGAAQGGRADRLPRVLVLTTGGTIASRPDAPSLPGRELVAAVPRLEDHARLSVEEFSRIGSSAMTPDHWLRLARRIGRAFQGDDGLAGVVVTHGTDSMEETAYFLHLTVSDPRPVVLTGSMRPATAVSADGPANLLQAVRVAVSPGARGKGAMVVLNGGIHGARAVRKMDNLRLDAFRSPGPGVLGWADPDTVVFLRTPVRVPGSRAFDLSEIDVLPRVALVSDYTGADGGALRHARHRGARGIVVSGFGGGRLSPGTAEAVAASGRAGVPVVVASRVPGGRIVQGTLPGPDGPVPMTDAGVAVARDLPPWKARVLLTLALTRTDDAGRIQALFDRH